MNIHYHQRAIVTHLRSHLPACKAIYLFGSYATGYANDDSDLDLGVWCGAAIDKTLHATTALELAAICGIETDLLDLSSCTRLLRYEVVTRGQRWFHDGSAELFEETARNMYLKH
jgi:predicted nucleotidyltransferase